MAKKEENQKFSQINFDKDFINKILEKLKVGNTRSIHLNAVPGKSAARLDLFKLSNIKPDLPIDFIQTILNNDSFSFEISFDKVDLNEFDEDGKNRLSLIVKRLNNMVIENEDNFLEFGLKNFGFGYPLLIKRDRNEQDKVIKAPIFIWNLDIERSYRKKNTWIIKKDEDSPIKINDLLISYLSKDESIQIKRISKEFLEDGKLDENELLELTKNILSQLNVPTDDLNIKVEKCPEVKQIEDIVNSKPWIQWSGVFGIYRSQNETIIHATEELLERFDEFKNEKLVLEPFQTSTIPAIETDPSKEEIINTLVKNEIKLIQGPPGTGKSQSITAIIANALANNAKCLIVCEKKTALDVIQSNLEKIKLDNFSVVIDDVNKDRKKVIEKARNIREYLSSPYACNDIVFSKPDFDEGFNKFCKLKKEVNSKHSEVLKKIFGSFSWKQLIGLYLKLSKSGDLNRIVSLLNYDELKFDHEEYSHYRSIIEEASLIYESMEKDLDDTFQIINKSLFTISYKWITHEKLICELNKLREILKAAVGFMEENSDDCYQKNNISIFIRESSEKSIELSDLIAKKLETIIALCSDLAEKGIHELEESSFLEKVANNILAIINNKYRKIFSIRANIHLEIDSANKFLSELKGMDAELEIKILDDSRSLESIKNNAIAGLGIIKKTKDQYKKIKNTEDKLLEFGIILLKIKDNKFLDFDLRDYISLGNRESIFSYYCDLLNKVEKALKHKDSYENFHNWKFFCNDKNEFELKILSILEKDLPKNWINIFSAWYYRGFLLNYESKTNTGFHKSDLQLKQLAGVYNDLCNQQVKLINSNWVSKRVDKISEISFNFNALYNLRKNSIGPKNSLRKIIEKDFELFTTLFPIILTNPAAANAILPLGQGIFSLVIFDEASQLRISDTFTTLIRGQYKIIAGDEHQMPPSNYFQNSSENIEQKDNDHNDVFNEQDEQNVLAEAESLLQYAFDLRNVNRSYLDFHYRSNHPALIEFSNSAFYGGNLVSFPERKAYNPIDFRAINGRYESRTNPSEVEEIIKILKNEIGISSKGNYPSIGIATFNINQRNLITEALNSAAEIDTEFCKKLQDLRDRGLFVKNLENIQGDERDIVIISTTYGIKPDGTFSQNFARLNRIEGYKLLNVLITRAKHKLYLCTSIPREKYLAYSEIVKIEGNNKKAILYAYLAYAEAISDNNKESAESILSELKKFSFEKPRIVSSSEGLSESPFEEEVYESLLDHFPKEKIIQQYKIGGFRLDFVIKARTKDIVLECDGKAYHQSDEAYAYDMYRQKELENMGFVVYRIWSTNWFQDKEKEMIKLVEFIKQFEK